MLHEEAVGPAYFGDSEQTRCGAGPRLPGDSVQGPSLPSPSLTAGPLSHAAGGVPGGPSGQGQRLCGISRAGA